MTNWIPDLADFNAPKYIAIADAMDRDVGSGILKPGARLPPQRELAYALKVTIGTISRAYALAAERGLVAGEIGRGTYVLDRIEIGAKSAAWHAAETKAASLDGSHIANAMRMDSTAAADVGQSAVIGQLVAEVFADEPRCANDYTRAISDEWREAGSAWLATGGWRPPLDFIVPIPGVLSGIGSVIAAITAPGDKIAFEELTYSAIARGATLIGRRSIKVRGGDAGLDPDDFENVCAREHPKALVLIPTLNNPTMTVMPEENRRRIAEIAHRHNVWIIEDNIYGNALDDVPPPFAAIMPEQTFHLSGVSKTLSAGLRAGWASCPPNFASRVINAKKLMTGGISYAMTEATARLVLSGEAARLKAAVLQETRAREAIAREVMAGHTFASDPHCAYIWLELPDPWLPGTYKKAALERGIVIDEADVFKVGQVDRVCHRVRIAFSAIEDRKGVRYGFETLRQLLDNASAGYDGME
ncbi:GntR family transcriptional regulator [Paramesorhizobium deserti]|uniref:GntR family transcriptional regulator n=1 Tax=Paramesorhizobium deserti TaxID=1494590 RepID=A0A135HWE0_9HYPH|nr:PLP-dependent aminotransferase family protein [Paramesorhizobium deserti]KXF77478.1 GntR family transcriptional regulator [Paramesorhizobium deserti]